MAATMASPSTAQRAARWAWTAAALACVLFGVMAIEFNFALRADDSNWWARVQSALTVQPTVSARPRPMPWRPLIGVHWRP